MVMSAAELNLTRLARSDGSFEIADEIADQLDPTSSVFCLGTSFTRRWEMNRKRAILSQACGSVTSAWNTRVKSDSADPWSIFEGGRRTKKFVRFGSWPGYNVAYVSIGGD
jgi:hypothetical protein